MNGISQPIRILLALLITAAVLAAVILIPKKQELYSLSPEAMLTVLQDEGNGISADALKEAMNAGDGKLRLIDIRERSQFNAGHIESAIPIHYHELLRPENIRLFSDTSLRFVLYGNTQPEATGPWMMLKQTGIDNVRVLLGGYSYYIAKDQGTVDTAMLIPQEKALFDYAALLEGAKTRFAEEAKAALAAPAPPPAPARIKSIPLTPKPAPVQAEPEEEEGC
jgi:3-mercaptopyruvate sulfurtransferase SseA